MNQKGSPDGLPFCVFGIVVSHPIGDETAERMGQPASAAHLAIRYDLR